MLDAIRYEFVRLRSLRSTWVLFATGPVIQFLFALIWATHRDMPLETRFDNAFTGVFLVLAVLPSIAVGVGAFGHEYRFRTIVTTTLTLRTPALILGAKAIVTALFGVASGVALIAATLLAEAAAGALFTDGAAIGHALLGTVVFTVLSCLLGLGIAAVSRNSVIALVAMIGFPTIIETLMLAGHIDQSLIPFFSAARLITTDKWSAPSALLALAVAFLAASWVTLRRRDA
ncbi:ABC transporter permease [Kutzneria sp. CA-103260]|uniref:ABC transporter permease n=1 Tax=Kutzneria sp. CA-103260 TaxID=2802641 RepID=UPI001BA8C0CA|nr:ABC transporter permease [Kutzneria sp. CA-103260]QUQ67907.1 ABC-2 family transporter protein [Kutzneria sp. CA-103260]